MWANGLDQLDSSGSQWEAQLWSGQDTAQSKEQQALETPHLDMVRKPETLCGVNPT